VPANPIGCRVSIFMAQVFLNGNLRLFTGGKSKFETDAKNVRSIFQELSSLYPDLEPHLTEGISVSIDGQIFQDAWLEAVAPNSEIHLFPQIAGG
tara:strand:+ start:43 stop:327 length:285 start_codon:yes stop_codon:yes gene_type:complete